MSSRTYSSYRLSEAERQRIELERQRRIKEEQERQEQERKRREEEERQKQLAEEGKRLRLVAEFRGRTNEFHRAYLADRLGAILRAVEGSAENYGSSNDLTSKAKRLLKALSSGTVDTDQILGDIQELEREANKLLSARVSRGAQREAQRRRKREEAMQLLEYLKKMYHAFPEELRQDFTKELDRVYHAILIAEQEKESNLTGNYEALNWAKREMVSIMFAIPEKARKRKEIYEKIVGEIEDVKTKLHTVLALAILDDHRSRANQLLSQLNALSEVRVVNNLAPLLGSLQEAASDLAAECEDSVQRHEERLHVMSIATSTLQEMGYSILPIPPDTNPPSGDSVRLYFRTPNREALEARFGLDRSINIEFVNLRSNEEGSSNSASQYDLDEKCKQCCDDIDNLNIRLRAAGMTLTENLRVQAGSEEYKILQVPSELLGEHDAEPRGEKRQRKRTL